MSPKRIAQVIRERMLKYGNVKDTVSLESYAAIANSRYALHALAADFARIFSAADPLFNVDEFKRSCSYELACRNCKGTGIIPKLDDEGMVDDYTECQHCNGWGWID